MNGSCENVSTLLFCFNQPVFNDHHGLGPPSRPDQVPYMVCVGKRSGLVQDFYRLDALPVAQSTASKRA